MRMQAGAGQGAEGGAATEVRNSQGFEEEKDQSTCFGEHQFAIFSILNLDMGYYPWFDSLKSLRLLNFLRFLPCMLRY